jgi:hypothetical protein
MLDAGTDLGIADITRNAWKNHNDDIVTQKSDCRHLVSQKSVTLVRLWESEARITWPWKLVLVVLRRSKVLERVANLV